MPYVNIENMQRLCAVINLVLITLGAYFAVSMFYQIIGMQFQPSYAASTSVHNSPTVDTMFVQPTSYYRPILERDLFHIRKAAKAASASPAVVLDELERTQLSLKLWGTVSGDPQQAYAVIEDQQRREQNLYRVGDTIQNATVKMILREKVILTFEGKDEVLDMADVQQAGASPGMIASRGRPPIAPPDMPSEGEQRITLQRNMLDESFSDLNRLMTEIAIAPNMEDGQPSGLSLSRIAPNSIFRRMGLRNGDVLLGVNGQQIQSPEDAMRMYEGLRSSDEIQLQLKRRGQERTIQYSIR